jgi:hypothetical protein
MTLRCNSEEIADQITRWFKKQKDLYVVDYFYDPILKGLEGLWGHRYRDDPDRPGKKILVHQFRVIKRLREEDEVRYLVEFGGWLTGTTATEVLSERELIGEYVVLYDNEVAWARCS